jgi:two-component system, cell cycle sensor histidine kinase and response regulator CckA
MDNKFLPIDASLDDDSTQTIELTELFTRDLSTTGSFDVRSEIWTTTFGKVIQALPIPALLIDQSFRIVVTNEAWGKISLKYEEMHGLLLSRLFPEASIARKVQALLEDVFSTRKPVVARGTLEIGDTRIWARMIFRSIRIMEERFILLLVEDLTAERQLVEQNRKHREELEKRVEERTSELMAANAQFKEEVAERKRMEEALRASEQRYGAFLNSTSDLAFLKDETFRYIMVNKANQEFFGKTEMEIIGKTDFELMPSVGAENCRRSDVEALGCDGIVVTEEESGGRVFETRKFAVKLNNGQTGIGGLVREVTERKKAQQALRESEERYRQITENSLTGVFIHQDGKFVYINRRAAQGLGYSATELIGKPVWEVVAPEDREMAKGMVAARLQGKQNPTHYQFRVLTSNGEIRWAEALATDIEHDNRPATLANVVDITDRKYAEEALRRSEERYRSLYEDNPSMYFTMDVQGTVLSVNRFGAEELGYSAEELVGQPVLMVFHEDDREAVRQQLAKCLQNPMQTAHWEFRKVRKDGSILWAKEVARSIRGVDGNPLVFVVCEDVTERKQAENALQESEERFRTAFQTSPDAVAITSLSDGVYIEANNGFTEITGFTREDLIGKSSLELNLWNARDRDRVIAELNERGHVTNLEAQFRLKDGRLRTGLMSARIIGLGGEPHLLTVTRDVEDWKKAEQSLRESEEKYRTLFEESIDAVYITTREGILVDANQAFLDLFGFSREEAKNMDILTIYTDAAERRRVQEEIQRKGSVRDYEIRYRKKDGTEIECLLSSALRLDKDGTILGYQGIIRDVTDRRLLQRQLLQAQKMEAIGTLAGGIAHDFNNLLQVTMGYSEVLLSKKDKAHPEYARLQQILQAGRSGAELVQRLLTLSRKTESKQRPIDLNQQIEQVRRLLDRTIPKMINIELRLEELLATVNADPTQIEQIIMNLAVNARDAMPEGGKLTLSTGNVILDEAYCRVHPGAKPGKYLLLAISDTGSGMDKEILDRMFEPFFTTKSVGGGTGLGLAMVYGIVKQHGGHITCESQPGHGTVFKIYLPAIEEQEIVSDELAEEPKLPGGTETILLVDDEDVVRDLGELILSESGYKVLTARNGKEALDIYRRERESISLVILDLIMPEMGGKQCMQELLKINPTMRVLVASGYASGGTARDAVQLGAKAFVNKPFNVAQLLQQVRTVLDLEL